MRWIIRLLTAVLLTLFSITILLSALFAYMVMTPVGGKLLVRYFKQEFCSVGMMRIGHFEGNLQNGFILKDIRITGLTYLPNALFRIQEIHVRLPFLNPFNYECDIFNARILLANSDPLVFTGRVYAGHINGNLYTSSVDIHEASRFWAIEDLRKNLQGFASDLDATVDGPLSSLNISGHFLADNISYKSINVTDGFSRLNLTFMTQSGQVQVKGQIIIDSGLVRVRKTNLDLTLSKINFQGNIFNPALDIHLGSKVEDMDINLTIKGTAADPQLLVTSDPPMSPQDALRVLFTGNAWSSSTSPFNGVTSSELAENFLDYSLQDMNEDQQLGLKTKLTDNLKLGAEMDQLPSAPGETNIYYSRKINGEMDMSEHMSLNVSQEILTQDRDPSQSFPDSQSPAETQIYLQYKKRF